MKYIVLCIAFFLTTSLYAQVTLRSTSLNLVVDASGKISSMNDNGKEYLFADTLSPLVRVKTTGKWENPVSVKFDATSHQIRLRYPSAIVIAVKALERGDYLTFEITEATPTNQIDRVIWGSFATTIGKTVGEIIGVVRDGQFAIGLQALNIKTTGGFPFNDEGYDINRGSVALARPWGSVLQAYSINRSIPRDASVWNGNFSHMPIVPLPGETVVGSKIALFGAAEKDVLATIGKIETGEGLPHPVYNGQWIRQSPEWGRSYIISDFAEEDVDEMIGHVKRSGLMSLYHEGPFKTWGMYEFNPEYFPHGKQGIKEAVAKAHAAGIHFGVHTLTNFINTSDPIVTPRPDDRLVKTGSSTLTAVVAANATEIQVASPMFFNEQQNNTLHTIQIGSELIRYREVTSTPPYLLKDCQRGAFQTKAASHPAGSPVGKLLDHGYEVFFPSITLQNEVAKRLAGIFNETGIDHLDFDGHEGGLASGQGDYGIEAFSKVFYDNTDHFVVNGTSNSKHFYWHQNTYCNWGEPWYGGFRESMQEYRISNQALFDRNYMPNMMGWYLMTGTTTLSEMEWMLARAAGYKAGFAMVLRVKDARKNPMRDKLLDAIREWETARREKAFTEEQRERLKNPLNEFHLEKIGEKGWKLLPFHTSNAFTHEKKDLQPGEPTYSVWQYNNTDEAQPLQFMLDVTGKGGQIINPVLTLDQSIELPIQVTLEAGEHLVLEGNEAHVYDTKGKHRSSFPVDHLPVMTTGSHTLKFNTSYGHGETSPTAIIRIKTMGKSEWVEKK